MRIALVGTRGVPARYGGFETCVEEVGRRLAERGHEVVVYCRPPADESPEDQPVTYLGMQLVHLPAWRRRALETPSHTARSLFHLRRHRPDVALVFNAANAPLLPLLVRTGVPVGTHVDGLEWKRTKWSGTGQRFYRAAEALAVRWSDALIADAQGIADYYTEDFGASTEQIAYGAPLVDPDDGHRLEQIGLDSRGYHLVVARFEPENHVDVIVDGYRRSSAGLPLVVVGSAPYSDQHTARIHELADSRVRFLGGVWDQDLLDQLYAHCATYLHGHSVGGTNPSLLRAIGAGAPTLAFDVVFNREVLGEPGRYFDSASAVSTLVEQAEAEPDATAARGRSLRERAHDYDWDDVAARYESLCQRLAAGQSQRGLFTGHRRKAQA